MEQEELLEARLGFLPTLQPEETLYSWCARYHRLSGNRLASDTSLQLFGAGTAGFWHDLPSRLDMLRAKTRGQLPEPRELTLRHTLLSFYAPYLTTALIDEAIEAMRGESVRSLKFRLGLPASRVGADHPLKSCPACLEEDRDQYGHGIWRIEQQWPSTWVCQTHGIVLMTCEARSKARNYLQWILPDNVATQDWRTVNGLSKLGSTFLLRMTEIAVELTRQTISLNARQLRQACLGRLHQRSWLLDSGRVNLVQMRAAFLEQTVGVQAVPGLGFIETVDNADGGFLGKALRKERTGRHPVKTLMLIAFLFDSAEQFLQLYRQQPVVTDEEHSTDNPAEDPRRKALATMIMEESMTVSAAARRLALPAEKAMYWARKDNLPYQRRPRLIDPTIGRSLEQDLIRGTEVHLVASRAGLPLTTVRRYLDTHDEVRRAWKMARHEQQRGRYRELFAQALATAPGATPAHLRSSIGYPFNWLQRHDQEWLASRLPMLGI